MWRVGAGWALAVLAVLLVAFWKPIRVRAVTGASYGAHIACSCHHIGGRPLSSCRDDFEAGMGLLMLTGDTEARSVTARYPLIASQTATYHAGRGCVLEPWED